MQDSTLDSVVTLFIPCLVDQVYPQIGIDMAKILKHLGYNLVYDRRQTCCGQPAFNAGHWDEAQRVAQTFIDVFSKAECIVCPSGSCTAMVKNYYPRLFENHPGLKQAENIGKCIFEFSAFLIQENQLEMIQGEYRGRVGFHNSCHSYRELGITDEPLKIINQINGIEILQPQGEPICCGFGGLFSFKYDQIAATMARTRLEMFTALGVETVVTNDPGCLMHMRQEAIDRQIDMELLHLSEFLVKAMKL